MRVVIHAVAIAVWTLCLSTVGQAQTSCRSDGFGNTHCSDGGGWRTDGFGNTYGTGRNSGGGWRSDGFGKQLRHRQQRRRWLAERRLW